MKNKDKIPPLIIKNGKLYERYMEEIDNCMIDGFEPVERNNPNYNKWFKIVSNRKKSSKLKSKLMEK